MGNLIVASISVIIIFGLILVSSMSVEGKGAEKRTLVPSSMSRVTIHRRETEREREREREKKKKRERER